MKFWNKICGLFLIFIITGLFSKAQVNKINFNIPPSSFNFRPYTPDSVLPHEKGSRNTGIVFNRLSTILPGNFYTQHFGFVCKKELQLEKASKIPFRFRLGSVQKCDILEGKNRTPLNP